MMGVVVKALLVEAAILVLIGFIVGWLFDSWKAIITAQSAAVVCEFAGYLIEARLRVRRGGAS